MSHQQSDHYLRSLLQLDTSLTTAIIRVFFFNWIWWRLGQCTWASMYEPNAEHCLVKSQLPAMKMLKKMRVWFLFSTVWIFLRNALCVLDESEADTEADVFSFTIDYADSCGSVLCVPTRCAERLFEMIQKFKKFILYLISTPRPFLNPLFMKYRWKLLISPPHTLWNLAL